MSDFTAGRQVGRAGTHPAAGTLPVMVLLAALAALPAGLAMIRTVPIGAMYWDLLIYFDAANRIFDGQVPNRDFFPPVGPLGYWLFAGGLKLFPNAQPLLLVDWSLLAVTGPLMALVVADVGARSRAAAFALLLPFLFFSLLPFDVENFSAFPGVDGFGIYNRQAARILYVLASALVFCEGTRRMGVVVAGAMLALFLTKITGFIAGGLLCALAFVAGRVRLSTTVAAVLAFAGALMLLEAQTGVVGAYLRDIEMLVVMNQGGILGRFLQAASVHFGVLLPCLLLTGTLAALGARPLIGETLALARRPSLPALAALLDQPICWLAVSAFAALFYETQNTGSQAFIFAWPALLLTLSRAGVWQGWRTAVVIALVAACSLPTLMNLVERCGRSAVGALKYERLETANLGTVGAVTQRGELMRHADTLLDAYVRNPGFYRGFAEMGQLPSFQMFAEPDYQIAFLKTLDEAVGAIDLYETANGTRFETVMNLGFVNPFPFLLDRHAPKAISIGADPFRTVPPPNEAVAAAVRATDLALYSKCPETAANRDLLKLYEPFLTDHSRVSLGRCWDGFVRNGLLRTVGN
ncbi:hypothetical protein [Aureimonas leprariae]|uniref:Glycosyltransferase RgtA/B/C/D-like domain-containing protein n=1 Tax=Plantimonas leprariae TaxID=2615207 RepID=A0A7V7PS71_9HYPH|nr:hypothetical protein [Aureimonas leprariae]KAB0681905.1 hypothetical protein F6X38_03545 [Aureimonas leprariae]